MARPPQPLEIRFWRYVNKTEGCWLWTGYLNRGYGQLRLGGAGSKKIPAHRYSYQLAYRPIADDVMVLHTCDVRNCVNPKHLYEGDHAKNMEDRNARGRTARGDRSGTRIHPESRARGISQGSSRFTDVEVVEVRRRRAAGEPEVSLARAFNVNRKTINNIVRRETWRHVDG